MVVRVEDDGRVGNVGFAELFSKGFGARDTGVWCGLELPGDGDGVLMLGEPVGEPGFGVLVVVERCGFGLVLVLVEPCWIPVCDGDSPGVALCEVGVQVVGDVQGFRGHGVLLSFILFFFVYT